MTRIRLFLFFLLAFSFSNSSAQCINDYLEPFELASNNSGTTQQISSCNYDDTYAQITNILIGSDYIFTCEAFEVHKYITVTNASNTVIAHGMSPLTVSDITAGTIRVHYSEDAACSYLESCNSTTLQVVLTCPFPTSIIVSGVTTSDANFSWTAGGGEFSWEALVLPAADPAPSPTTSGNTVLSNSFSTSGLSIASPYNFYVRANCGSEYSPWTNATQFTTNCNPVATFYEDFNSTADGTLPTCWTGVINGAGASPNAYIITSNFDNEGAVVISNDESAATANIILVSPSLSTLSDGTHRLKFRAKSGYPGTIDIGTVSSSSNDAVFTLVQQISTTAEYVDFTVSFTGYTGTNTFIGIRNASEPYNSAIVDNIRWELAPLCPDVEDIAVVETTVDSATISWEAGGAQTAWDIVFGELTVTDPDTLTPVTLAPSGTPQYELTGLTDNTKYNVWVRTVCGSPNGNGAWIGPIVVKTQCLPTDTFNENFDTTSGDDLADCWSSIITGDPSTIIAYVKGTDFNSNSPSRSVEINNGTSSNSEDVILVSPNLGNLSAGTHRIKFWATSYSPSSIQVGTLDSNTSPAVFTPVQTIATTAEYVEYTVDFTTITTTDTFIGFRHNAINVFDSVFIDDVKWELAPLCGDVTNILLTEITPDTATITWTPSSSGETQWEIVVGESTVTDPTVLTPIAPNPTTATATLSGLLANTDYNVWVRSVCGGSDGNGVYIGPLNFTTACDPTTSFDEGFETIAFGALPECWSRIISTTGTTFSSVGASDSNPFAGTSAVEIYYDAFNANQDDHVMLVSPNVNDISEAMLSFYAKSSFGEGTMEIGTVNSTLSSAVFTSIETIALTAQYTQFTIDLSGYSGTDTYLAFRNVTGSFVSLSLDDIMLSTNLANPDFDTRALLVYPNPVKDIMQLSYQEIISEVAIYNLLGQKVHSEITNSNNVQMDLSRLTDGAYVVKATIGNTVKNLKIIKQ